MPETLMKNFDDAFFLVAPIYSQIQKAIPIVEKFLTSRTWSTQAVGYDRTNEIHFDEKIDSMIVFFGLDGFKVNDTGCEEDARAIARFFHEDALARQAVATLKVVCAATNEEWLLENHGSTSWVSDGFISLVARLAVDKGQVDANKEKVVYRIGHASAEFMADQERRDQARLAAGLDSEVGTGRPMDSIRMAIKPRDPKKTEQIGGIDDVYKVAEAVRLESEKLSRRICDDLELGASRIGGVPDLQSDDHWPSYEGKKIPFIAQIDLAANTKIDKWPLPDSGTLVLFALVTNDKSVSGTPAAALYIEGPSSSLVRCKRPAPHELWQDWTGVCEYETYPVERFMGRRARLKEGERFGGELFGKPQIETDMPGDLADRAILDGTDWIQFLAVDSIGTMQWSDMGVLRFCARKSDLAEADFSNIVIGVDSA